MAQKAKTPSSNCQLRRTSLETVARLTNGSHDLGLQAKLVLEATGKVADTAAAISGNIGNLANVVEHVSAGEEKDGNEADGGPEIAVLDDGQNIRRGSDDDRAQTKNDGDGRNPAHPVDRTLDRRVRPVSQVSREPCVNLIGRLRSTLCVSLFLQ